MRLFRLFIFMALNCRCRTDLIPNEINKIWERLYVLKFREE
jgi:hypothetical protein